MNTFSKHNPKKGSTSLKAEVRGLDELRRFQERHGLQIPVVLQAYTDELVLERIDAVQPRTEDWERLGRGLAILHQVHHDRFGFEEDNWIGLCPQKNLYHDDWGQFFVQHRLKFQIDRIQQLDLRETLQARLTKFKEFVMEFLNHHRPSPSLLHGDLWSGNVLFDAHGPWLIDPSVYYGDREVDIAMTKMFGGFDPSFYKAYEAISPLPNGHSDRAIIYNLYHFLNHMNLFGDSYRSGVEAGFAKLERLSGGR